MNHDQALHLPAATHLRRQGLSGLPNTLRLLEPPALHCQPVFPVKRCNDCWDYFVISDKNFSKRIDRNGKKYWDSYCRACKRERAKKWYILKSADEQFREQRRQYTREYQRKNGTKAKVKK